MVEDVERDVPAWASKYSQTNPGCLDDEKHPCHFEHGKYSSHKDDTGRWVIQRTHRARYVRLGSKYSCTRHILGKTPPLGTYTISSCLPGPRFILLKPLVWKQDIHGGTRFVDLSAQVPMYLIWYPHCCGWPKCGFQRGLQCRVLPAHYTQDMTLAKMARWWVMMVGDDGG